VTSPPTLGFESYRRRQTFCLVVVVWFFLALLLLWGFVLGAVVFAVLR
jgi:hypothetical protein